MKRLTKKHWEAIRKVDGLEPLIKEIVALDGKQKQLEREMKALSQPRPMTLAQAREDAKRRWGKNGKAWKHQSGNREVFYVGIKGKGYESYYGQGPTWEAAFADADRREEKENVSDEQAI